MAKMALAYTTSGVESVALIEQETFDSLATWLCNDKDYHDAIEGMRKVNNPTSWRKSDAEFDREVKANGGYCNICKDFAGELLSHFELVAKVQP